MPKVVLAIVFIPLLAFGGWYWYFTHQISKQLDELAGMMAPFASLSYDSVSLGLGGEVRVNRISVRSLMSPDYLEAERIVLRTDSLGELQGLKREIEAQRLPASLALAIEGLRFDLSSDLIASADVANVSIGSVGLHEAAGCGRRQQFSAWDLGDLGFRELIMDMEIGYRLVDDGRELHFSGITEVRGHSRQKIEGLIDLNANSRAVMDVMTVVERARLRRFSADIDELGYYTSARDFCMAETGLEGEAYLDHHLAHWQWQWQGEGVDPGESALEAYRRFMQQPQSLSLTVEPPGGVALATADSSAYLRDFLSRPGARLSVNGEAAQPLRVNRVRGGRPARPPIVLEGVELEPEAEALAQSFASSNGPVIRRLQQEAQPRPRSPSWKTVAVADLGAYFDLPVRLDLRDGSQLNGRLHAIEAGRLSLRIHRYSGYMVRGVDLADIEQVQVQQ